jgi:uncharacterized protein YfcZ (UPF0381/DUF406 family)
VLYYRHCNKENEMTVYILIEKYLGATNILNVYSSQEDAEDDSTQYASQARDAENYVYSIESRLVFLSTDN